MGIEQRSNILMGYRVNKNQTWYFCRIIFLFFRPTVDHTLGTSAGHYAYIESSFPQMHGDKAWLVSEVLESPMGACLDFWYHMKGNSTGNLTVYQRVLNNQPISIWFLEVRNLQKNVFSI